MVVAFRKEKAVKISLESTGNVMSSNETTQPLRLGVFSVASPKTTMEYYEGLRDYLSKTQEGKLNLCSGIIPARSPICWEAVILILLLSRRTHIMTAFKSLI